MIKTLINGPYKVNRSSEEANQSEMTLGNQGGYPRVYDWLGTVVLVTYEAGPYLDADKPFEIARGRSESRAALFGLEEVSGLGIVVRKLTGAENALPSVFLSWGAIRAIQQIPPEELRDSQQKHGSPYA